MVNYNFSVTKMWKCFARQTNGRVKSPELEIWAWCDSESHLGYFCPKHQEVSDLKIEKQHCLLQAPQLTCFVLLWPFMGTHNTAESEIPTRNAELQFLPRWNTSCSGFQWCNSCLRPKAQGLNRAAGRESVQSNLLAPSHPSTQGCVRSTDPTMTREQPVQWDASSQSLTHPLAVIQHLMNHYSAVY